MKIADFGLARDLNEDEYCYVSKNQRALPIRWMAPEAIKDHKFTTKSDVVSTRISEMKMAEEIMLIVGPCGLP